MNKVVSFCFDDGFRSSTEMTARMFDARGLSATFCVLASPSTSADPAHAGASFADWAMLRALRERGHDVAPHGWAHERLTELPVEEGRRGLERMFNLFERELPGFRPDQAVFHAAYLQLPDELREWLLPRVRGVRLACSGLGSNEVASAASTGMIDCVTFGPGNVAATCRKRLRDFAAGESQWQVIVLHGLDGEGWGSLASDDLAYVLDQIRGEGIAIRSVAQTLEIAGQGPAETLTG